MIINSGSYVAGGGGVTLKQAEVVAETGLSQNTIQSDIQIVLVYVLVLQESFCRPVQNINI